MSLSAGSNWIGSFSIGDDLEFFFVSRDEDASVPTSAFDPTHYDIYDVTMTIVGTLDDQNLTQEATEPSAHVWTPTTPVALTVANGFSAGSAYMIILKEGTSQTPSNYAALHFRITHEHIGGPETGDSTVEASPNSGYGRMRSVERNQMDHIMPRLSRTLGLLGENQLVDGYLYDDAGNITACRVRVFDTKTNRDAASIWADRVNDIDPAATMETGELERYDVTANHSLARNLRTLYESVITTDAPDTQEPSAL